jgi:magnesium chelatase subunit D
VPYPSSLVADLADQVVGRDREIELLVAALECGAHVVLEGPPGTGKTTLLRAVAQRGRLPFVFVEGNAELTPGRMVGHFDPSRVLAEGYCPDVFVDGPLVSALRDGALFYVEEINRVPEETLNVLITVMSEGELHVPRLGRVAAAQGFRLVAAMNPFDTVGTARISASVYDRTCRITMDYQDAADEAVVLARRAPAVASSWRAQVVELVRLTRREPDIRVGSSVRGAIDLVKVAVALAQLRGLEPMHWRTGLDASLVALSGRIRLNESCARRPEAVVTELYERVFGRDPGEERDRDRVPGMDAELSRPAPGGPSPPGARASSAKKRTVGRPELSANPNFAAISPEVGVLDADALDALLAEDPDAALTLLAELANATDELLRGAARRLAGKIVLDRSRTGMPRARGVGKLRRVSAEQGGDVDIDESLEAIAHARAQSRAPALAELVARNWARPELALCLALDRSGSMGGARLAAAALTAAACAWRAPGDYAVLTFARTAEILRPMNSAQSAGRLVDDILALRGHGTTSVGAALRAALEQLSLSQAARRVVVLLSDCRATTDGDDPVSAAAQIPELVILAPASDCAQAEDLARRSGARWGALAGPADAPNLLLRLLA